MRAPHEQRSHEVERVKPRAKGQLSIAELPAEQQAAAMDHCERASSEHPSVQLSTGNWLHVCENDGEWEAWLNTEVADFDGLCIGSGATRQEAVTQAVAVLEAALDKLQGPPW